MYKILLRLTVRLFLEAG